MCIWSEQPTSRRAMDGSDNGYFGAGIMQRSCSYNQSFETRDGCFFGAMFDSSRCAYPPEVEAFRLSFLVEMWRKKHNAFAIVYSWFLAKVAYKLEVFPGSEFRVAYEEAIKYGCRVMLGDRPVQVTDLLEIPQKPAVSAVAILKSVGVAVATISGIYFSRKR